MWMIYGRGPTSRNTPQSQKAALRDTKARRTFDGEPCEGEPHARFGGGLLETGGGGPNSGRYTRAPDPKGRKWRRRMQARRFPLTALRQWPTLPAIRFPNPMNGVPILRRSVLLENLLRTRQESTSCQHSSLAPLPPILGAASAVDCYVMLFLKES